MQFILTLILALFCGIASAAPGIVLQNGSGTEVGTAANPIYVSGGTGGSSQWDNGVDSAIYYNDGNVGIGSSSPRGKLDVDGVVYADTIYLDGLGYSYSNGFLGIGTTIPRGSIDATNDGYIYGKTVILSQFNNGYIPKSNNGMLVDSSIYSYSTDHITIGSIPETGGYGTGSNRAIVTIYGNGANANALMLGNSSDVGFELRSTGSSQSTYIDFTDRVTSVFSPDYATRLLRAGTANGDFSIINSGTGKMIFTNNGSTITYNTGLGIGSTTPRGTLDVRSSTGIDGFIYGDGSRLTFSGDLGIGSSTPQGKLDVDGNIYGNNFINPDSSVTYGSTKNAAGISTIVVGGAGSDSSLILKSSTNGGTTTDKISMRVANSSNDSLTIIHSGYVGIGTNNPQANLHVGAAATPNHIDGSNDVFVNDAMEVEGNIYVDGSIYGYGIGFSSGKAICWHSTGRQGYCSSAVGAGGDCTCN